MEIGTLRPGRLRLRRQPLKSLGYARQQDEGVKDKKLIKDVLGKNQRIFAFLDMHGHSRKKNIFMYGNSAKGDTKFRERIFPYVLEK